MYVDPIGSLFQIVHANHLFSVSVTHAGPGSVISLTWITSITCHICFLPICIWHVLLAPVIYVIDQNLFSTKKYVCAKSLQLCSTLCNPMDSSLPGPSDNEILQAKILEWLPCPSPGCLPDLMIQPMSLRSPALVGRFFTTSTTWTAH